MIENGYHGSHVLPVPKRGRKKPTKALNSMLLPGCCLVMMRFGVLTTILRRYDLWKPIVSNEVVSYKCLGTLEPKKVTQLNSKTWENSCSRFLDSFFMWFLGDVQVQNVSFLIFWRPRTWWMTWRRRRLSLAVFLELQKCDPAEFFWKI